MSRRLPGSVRTRQSLSDLIEGRLSWLEGRADLGRLATRLIVEEALEGASRDALGREYRSARRFASISRARRAWSGISTARRCRNRRRHGRPCPRPLGPRAADPKFSSNT
jgi:hypothetical protein